jgi:cell division protein FtsI (penicillin-binding protein 3)
VKRWRHYAAVVFFLVASSGLGARVVYLNVSEREFLQEQGDARSVRTETISAYRGVVYDRSGEPLALSTPVVAVWVDPSQRKLTDAGVEQIARTLGLDARRLAARLARNPENEFLYLRRRVSREKAERVRELALDGVYFHREYRRYYPAGETAAHVVGVTDIDDRGLEGVELAFDEVLRGVPGRKVVLKDRRGDTVKDLEFLETPRFGGDLKLSIDLRLQFLAYRELKSAVESHRATSGSMVMLDVASGEILALVNQPSYNPNELGQRVATGMRNRAVTDTYEPGSTIKPFTVLAALESGQFERQSIINTSPGYFRVGNKLIQDPANRGAITLETALQKSSQVGIAKVALALDERAVYDMLARIGIGEYLSTGMPGEVSGSMSDLGLRYPVVRATLAYGYGLAVTPLQLAQGYLCLATGGVRLPISILRQPDPPVGVRVVSEALAREVVEMMEGVTQPGGTAPKARVAGYRVAGKTGTARKVGTAGYDDERHVAWFAGIAPASQPRIVAVVVVNEPRGRVRGGGAVAAPVFARVVARALRLLGVSPDVAPSV